MPLSSSDVKRLLCPNPFHCGPQSGFVPPEVLETSPFIKIVEKYKGIPYLTRCSGCDRLAVRRLQFLHPDCAVFLDATGMADVPGVSPADGNRRRNLLADAYLYASQCLGVISPVNDIMLFGSEPPTDEEVWRTFPMEEAETESKPAASPNAEKCTQCGAPKHRLLKCSGVCGGAVAFCNRDCQVKHWKQGHKKECWKVADSNTFSFRKNDKVIPLRAIHLHDGFGKSGLCLYYSNHLGHEVSSPLAEQLLGEFDPQSFEETIHASMTSPVYDDTDRFRLKQGEACFNISKNPHEFNALVEHKIITPTDKTLQIGGYPTRHPICRINLPLYKREESG